MVYNILICVLFEMTPIIRHPLPSKEADTGRGEDIDIFTVLPFTPNGKCRRICAGLAERSSQIVNPRLFWNKRRRY